MSKSFNVYVRRDDLHTIAVLAEQTRRPKTNFIKNLLLDVLSGHIDIGVPCGSDKGMSMTITGLTTEQIAQIKALKDVYNLPLPEVVHRALERWDVRSRDIGQYTDHPSQTSPDDATVKAFEAALNPRAPVSQ